MAPSTVKNLASQLNNISLASDPATNNRTTFSTNVDDKNRPNTSQHDADSDDEVTGDNDDDVPALDGGRNHSISSDGTIDSLVDENPTPPGSPLNTLHFTPPSFALRRPSTEDPLDQASEMHFSNPSWKHKSDPHRTPTHEISHNLPIFFETTPPTPPRGSEVSPSLATRRAKKGKLSPKALLSLQQMRFDSPPDAGAGLGVGPGSPGFEAMNLTPSPRLASPASAGSGGAGIAFRLALGLDDDAELTKQVVEEDTSTPTRDAFGLSIVDVPRTPSLASPRGLHRQKSWSANPPSPRSRVFADSRNHSPIPVANRSPALRPFKLASPLLSSSPRDRQNCFELPPSTPQLGSPSSPVLSRSSAFTSSFSNGPLTPLTPSHVPNAPMVDKGSNQFDWVSYAVPDSPVTPQGDLSPLIYTPVQFNKCGFSSPSLSSDRPALGSRSNSFHSMPPSPLCN